MGNYFLRCYQEENDEQPEEKEKQQVQIYDSQNIGTLSQEKQINFDQIQDAMIFPSPIQIQFQIGNTFGVIFQELTQLCNISFDFDKQQLENINLTNLFQEPFLRISADKIQQFVSNQFQLQIALQRYSLGEKYLGNLNETELLIAEAIKANITIGLVPLFKSIQPMIFENKKLEKVFEAIKIVYFVCDFFLGVLQKYIKESCYHDNIKIYNLLYYQFQKLILNLNYENEQHYNSLPQQKEQQYQFSFLGYAMRFWRQIVFALFVDGQPNNLRSLLIDSFRNVVKKDMEIEIYKYILGAIDLCSNEYTINWIGHDKKFQIEKFLIDISNNEFNNIQFNNTFKEYSVKINEQQDKCFQQYPRWIYEIYYIKYSLDLKIKKLMSEIKKIYEFNQNPIQKQESQQEVLTTSYSELPTGLGLFEQDEKAVEGQINQMRRMNILKQFDEKAVEAQINQMRRMNIFIQLDEKVSPSISPSHQKPYDTVEYQPSKEISIKFSSELILSRPINEKVKSINQQYFQELEAIRQQYIKIIHNIKRRNFILENRILNRKIGDDAKPYQYAQIQQVKDQNFLQLVETQKQVEDYRQIKEMFLQKVDLRLKI